MAVPDALTLGSRPLRLADLRRIYAGVVTVAIDPSSMRSVREAHAVTMRLAAAEAPAYGINTGFGLLAQTSIAPAQRSLLQRNIILSHSTGVGPLLDDAIVRLTLVLKLASLLQGFSGVSPELARFLERLINTGLMPCVPSQGSVGASGDLAPLAHLSLAVLGLGTIRRQGECSAPPRPSRRRDSHPSLWAPKRGWRFSMARRSPPHSRSRDCSSSKRCSQAPW
jgi:histidine ammonia-lyase